MHMKLEHIRTFLAVVRNGSLTEAAKTLGRTPSAISMSLKQFTEQLGDELFETDRKSTLTPFGRFVFEQTQHAVDNFDQHMQAIERYSSGNFGTVKVAAIPSFSTQRLPQIMADFVAAQPNVRLDLRDMDSASINNAVRNGLVDLGIASDLSGPHQLRKELLLEEPFGVAYSHRHTHIAQKDSISWQQLAKHPFISHDLLTLIHHHEIDTLKRQAKFHIHNITTLLTFIRQGFGITILPHSAINNHADLDFLTLADNTAFRRLFIIQHKNNPLSPAANNLKQRIKISILGDQNN